MKSFVKKVTVLAVAFSMASSTLANAQEEDGKVNFSVQGDLVSSYIWRGFYQTGASFQPTLSLGVGNFSLTAWGSTDFQGANSTSAAAAKEIDLTAAYTFGSAGPTLSVASLWWAGQGAGDYFNFKSHETAHHFEAGLAYTLPIEKFPLSITWNFSWSPGKSMPFLTRASPQRAGFSPTAATIISLSLANLIAAFQSV